MWGGAGWVVQSNELIVEILRECPNLNGTGEEDLMDGISSRVIARLDK